MELGAQLDRTNADFFAGQTFVVVQLLPRGSSTRTTQVSLILVLHVSEVKKKSTTVEAGTQYRKALGLQEQRRGQQGESRVKKLDRLTCNERCSAAIKRTGITSRLSASISILIGFTLTEKDRESLAFCKRAGTPIQIYLYARFLGFRINR